MAAGFRASDDPLVNRARIAVMLGELGKKGLATSDNGAYTLEAGAEFTLATGRRGEREFPFGWSVGEAHTMTELQQLVRQGKRPPPALAGATAPASAPRPPAEATKARADGPRLTPINLNPSAMAAIAAIAAADQPMTYAKVKAVAVTHGAAQGSAKNLLVHLVVTGVLRCQGPAKSTRSTLLLGDISGFRATPVVARGEAGPAAREAFESKGIEPGKEYSLPELLDLYRGGKGRAAPTEVSAPPVEAVAEPAATTAAAPIEPDEQAGVCISLMIDRVEENERIALAEYQRARRLGEPASFPGLVEMLVNASNQAVRLLAAQKVLRRRWSSDQINEDEPPSE